MFENQNVEDTQIITGETKKELRRQLETGKQLSAWLNTVQSKINQIREMNRKGGASQGNMTEVKKEIRDYIRQLSAMEVEVHKSELLEKSFQENVNQVMLGLNAILQQVTAPDSSETPDKLDDNPGEVMFLARNHV